MTSLQNFEKWLVDNGLKPWKFISPLDRLLRKCGYSGPPLVYWKFPKLWMFLSLYWLLTFPITFSAIFWILRNVPFSRMFQEPIALPIHLLGALFFGISTAYFSKRAFKKVKPPPWSEFTDK